MNQQPPSPAPTRWVAWWVGTWLVGVTAGSLVIGLLHAPSRPDDAAGPGDVLAAPIGVLGASLVALWTAYLVGMWLASERLGSGSFASDYGVRFAPVDLLGLPIGVATQLAVVPLLYLPLEAIWPETFADDRLADTAQDLVDRADGGLIVLLFALVVVGAPVVEELFFRGFLQRPLLAASTRPGQRAMVVVAVALVFGAIHFRPVELPGLAMVGVVLGVCAWRTDRLGMPIAAHVSFNATGVVLAL